MISILIPIYQENCVKLVRDLHSEARSLGDDFEILVFDDCSPVECKENERILALENVNYRKLPRNVGRARIRNLLAANATGDILIFLDGDSGIVRKDFLQRYLEEMKNRDFVRGGTVYCDSSKVRRDQFLHWKYGTLVESDPKGKHPDMFSTNNFCIRKSVFSLVKFDEGISGYGHEDTVFALQMEKKGYRVFNIDNPVEHLGLKTFEEFMRSQESAVRNLKRMESNPEYAEVLQRIRMMKAAGKLRRWGLEKIYAASARAFRPFVLSMLGSGNPPLCLLSLYKLGIYFSLLEGDGES